MRMSKAKYLRIGNIAFKPRGKYNKQPELVKYTPNIYYGKINEFKWSWEHKMYYKGNQTNPRVYVHKSCFKDPECASTICKVIMDSGPNRRGMIYQLNMSGWRCEELTEQDWLDIRAILRQMNKV